MRGDPRIVKIDGALEEALEGARILHDVVVQAYGPTSFNVALQKSYGPHVISHDGVTIAKDVILRNEDHNIGADQLYQAARKSDGISGDGTSVTTILGYHIMKKAHQRILAGHNPMALRRGIELAGRELVKYLDTLAVKIADNKLHQVATIASGDPEIGQLVAETVIQSGGVGITVEEYEGLGVLAENIKGVYFEKGWALPHFVNNSLTQEVLHDNMYVICLEKHIRANQDIVPILEMIDEENKRTGEYRGVLIIGNLKDKALMTCAITNHGGGLKVCVVEPPVYGTQVLGFMEDIAALTGGKIVPQSMPAEKVTTEYLGTTKKIIVTQSTTTLLEPGGDAEVVANRITELQEQLDSDKYSAFDKDRMESRMAKLQGKIGIIRVGGATSVEREEKKQRIDDAVGATRGAKEEGIVPGGGVTLARLSLIRLPGMEDLTPDELVGANIVLEALQEPFKRLMINAGESADYRLSQIKAAKKDGMGFNVKEPTTEPIDLVKAGIIDPVRVLKSAIENSCSVAGIVITLGASITIDRDYQLEQLQVNRMTQ